MKDRVAKLAGGFFVEGHCARVDAWASSRSVVQVTLRYGAMETSHLAPAEARALAAALIEEADYAENGGYRG